MKGVSCNKTKGVVLIVVLVLLLSMSLAGVSSLRNGMYQQRMVSDSQVEVFAFQATESAISSVLEEGVLVLSDEEDSYFRRAITHGRQVNCFDGSHFSKDEAHCHTLTVFGLENTAGVGQLYSYAVTEKKGILPAPGYDVDAFVFHVFDTTGVGYIGDGQGKSVGHAHANTQRWKRFGVASGFDVTKPR